MDCKLMGNAGRNWYRVYMATIRLEKLRSLFANAHFVLIIPLFNTFQKLYLPLRSFPVFFQGKPHHLSPSHLR